jgi:acetyl esterase/lipase
MSLGVLLIVGGLLYHFAALYLFNALAPRDAGVTQVASNIAFDNHARQKLDIYMPDGAGPFPTLVFVYGGSWDTGTKDHYNFAGHAMAAMGYITIIADYRLVPEVVYPQLIDDTASAIAWAHKHAAEYGGKPDEIYLVGHSAGAYNLAQAVLSGAVKRQGVPDGLIRAAATLSGPFDFLPLDSPKSIAAFSHLKNLEESQPVFQDLSAAPPFLIMHGADDKTVNPKNARSLHRHLTEAGRKSELKIYDGITHVSIMLALSKPFRGNAPVLADIAAFFKKVK